MIWLIVFSAALFSALGALAEEAAPEHADSHQTEERQHGPAYIRKTDDPDTHAVLVTYDLYCLDCGRIIRENARTEETAAPHNWKTTSTQKATCTKEGQEIRLCSVCGTEDKKTLPILAHQYAAASLLAGREAGPALQDGKTIGVVTAAPSCTKSGRASLICLQCGGASQSVELPALEHAWGDWTAQEQAQPSCTADQMESRTCGRCGETESRVAVPAPGHQWEEIKRRNATCAQTGLVVWECAVCGASREEELPEEDHTFAPASLLAKQPVGSVAGSGEYAGVTIGTVKKASTCAESGSGSLLCVQCQAAERAVTIPRGEHRWTEWETREPEEELTPEARCVTDVTAARYCLDCGEEETKVVIPAPGHQWMAVSYAEPTCTENGRAVRRCASCGKEDVIETPAQGHYYMWVDRPDGDMSDYICAVCGDIAETKSKEGAQIFYNNTITSFGPAIRDLIGGSVWNRVTPLDLSVEGVFSFPLIASNRFAVGTATVTIEDGVQWVTYQLSSSRITVHSEALVIYPSLDALRTGENAVSLNFDAPIVIHDYFGTDTQVIMAVTLKADYDASAPGVQWFQEDQEMIGKLKNLID